MFWEGNKYKTEDLKVLVLGESHHHNNEYGKELHKDFTKDTIERYLNYKEGMVEREKGKSWRWTCFFTVVSKIFGYVEGQYRDFYNKVLFANYIDVSCGKGTSHAEVFLSDDSYRCDCNNKLFELVNEKTVDLIVCFSKRVYKKLPSISENSDEWCGVDSMNPGENDKKDEVSVRYYLPKVDHNYCDIKLKKGLKVICFKHPRSGLKIANASAYLKKHCVIV